MCHKCVTQVFYVVDHLTLCNLQLAAKSFRFYPLYLVIEEEKRCMKGFGIEVKRESVFNLSVFHSVQFWLPVQLSEHVQDLYLGAFFLEKLREQNDLLATSAQGQSILSRAIPKPQSIA